MREFFVVYRPAQGDLTKHSVSAPDAPTALKSVGWPKAQVFGIIQYFSRDEIDRLLEANPAGQLMSFDEWEAKFGPATSPEHLWVQPSEADGISGRHPALNGSRVRLCALTGHARFVSIGEHYDNWICPDAPAAA